MFTPTITLVKDLKPFDASHQLTSHKGKCRNLHGHTYHVQVVLGSRINGALTSGGMVIDFDIINKIYQPIHDVLDHAIIMGEDKPRWFDILRANCDDVEDLAKGGLGKIAYIPYPETTAEWIASWIFEQMSKGLAGYINQAHPEVIPYIHSIRLAETETSWAIVGHEHA